MGIRPGLAGRGVWKAPRRPRDTASYLDYDSDTGPQRLAHTLFGMLRIEPETVPVILATVCGRGRGGGSGGARAHRWWTWPSPGPEPRSATTVPISDRRSDPLIGDPISDRWRSSPAPPTHAPPPGRAGPCAALLGLAAHGISAQWISDQSDQ